MYKRPPLRVKDVSDKIHDPIRFQEGTLLHKLFNTRKAQWHEQVKQPIYQKDSYLILLKKNCEDMGIEFKGCDVPDYIHIEKKIPHKEPELLYLDHVYVKTKILKSGVVRVKLDTSFATLYEKYYSKNKVPPQKAIIQAYKSMGFSDQFLDMIKRKCDKKVKFLKNISAAIDAIFNKEPIKKLVKKKKEEVIEDDEIVEEDDQDEVEEDDDPGEDGEMDIEVDEDLDDEQPQEEIYLSDGGE